MSTPTSFKTLHSFTVSIDREIVETTTREENGQKITVESKATKSVPHTIVLKEPGRLERQNLSVFQAQMYSQAINLGLLPKLVMQQKVGKDANSPLSEEEDRNIAAMNVRLQELSSDYMRLGTDTSADTEEMKARRERLLIDYGVLYKRITDLNTAYQSVYAYTAENYQLTKTLSWLTLFLTYVKTAPDAVPTPLFPGADFAAREERAGDLEDANDALYKAALKDDKLQTYWQLYLFNRANKTEDFVAWDEQRAKDEAIAVKIREEAAKVAAEKVVPKGTEPDGTNVAAQVAENPEMVQLAAS